MNAREYSGWLLDLYAAPGRGLALWLLADTGERLRFFMDFPVTFYAAGDFPTLRRAWVFLRGKDVVLSRLRRRDLFRGERDVLAVTVPQPAALPMIFRGLASRFPALDYYDVDIPLALRFAAQTGLRLLGRARFVLEGERVAAIEALDSPWDLDPVPLPLRILNLAPDADPAHRLPTRLRVRYERADYALSLEPIRVLILSLRATLRAYDPDLILTDYGDTWLFPQLRGWSEAYGIPLNPNRDEECQVLTRRAESYFAYGQAIYRGEQTHLFGRWHIDRRNALLFDELGLDGVLEQSRVSGLNVQDMARKSPGAGITALQMLTALQRGVLTPLHKGQTEERKTLLELIRSDRGGLIYQPVMGIHRDVAQIDFASMYPSIMIGQNISPETAGKRDAEEGLIPTALRPLRDKRLALKNLLLALDRRDCRAVSLQARAAALKWLLVVCFGYLGYKNARFGRIESYEAVTAASRELLLQAKEAAEAMGFVVLHMYIDSLFVQQDGLRRPEDFSPLLAAICEKTGLPIALEGVYRWLAFPPSRRDARVPVANRYFGVFQDGEVKARGIALRRRDTCRFAAALQAGMLNILALTEDPHTALPEALDWARRQIQRLKRGEIPLEDLVLSQSLSREVDAYRTPSPAARAARQLQQMSKPARPGMRIRFVYVRGDEKVRAWDAGGIETQYVDVEVYQRLAERAVEEIAEVFLRPAPTNLIALPMFTIPAW